MGCDSCNTGCECSNITIPTGPQGADGADGADGTNTSVLYNNLTATTWSAMYAVEQIMDTFTANSTTLKLTTNGDRYKIVAVLEAITLDSTVTNYIILSLGGAVSYFYQLPTKDHYDIRIEWDIDRIAETGAIANNVLNSVIAYSNYNAALLLCTTTLASNVNLLTTNNFAAASYAATIGLIKNSALGSVVLRQFCVMKNKII